MLGGTDEIGIDGSNMLGIGLTAPSAHKALDNSRCFIDVTLRDHRLADSTRGLRDERQCHDGNMREVLPGHVIVNIQQRLKPPRGCEHRDRRLDVHTDVAGVDGDGEGLCRWQTRIELGVHEESPYVAVGDTSHKVFDIHAAVAQGAAFTVGLGDLGFEGDDAFESGDEVAHVCLQGGLFWAHPTR